MKPKVTVILAGAAAAAVLATHPMVGYAADLVTGADIENGTVTSKDIKNGTLKAADLRDGVLAGAQGPTGPVGPPGPQGPAGPVGQTGPQGVTGPSYVAVNKFEFATPTATPDEPAWTTLNFNLPSSGPVLIELMVPQIWMSCSAGVAQIGAYLDGTPVPGTRRGTGTQALPNTQYMSATTASLSAGAHVVRMGIDCPLGDITGGTAESMFKVTQVGSTN